MESGSTLHARADIELLTELHLFKGVKPGAIQRLLRGCESRTFDAGEVLLRPGQVNDQMFLILNGSVSIHLESLEQEPLAILGAGESVGEMSFFDGKPTSAFVRIHEPSVMLVIRRKQLWDMVEISHAVARNLLYSLSQRIRATNIALTEIQKQKRLHERAASRDGLTGLHNRHWLEGLLERMSGKDLIPYLPLSVVMLDLDHFKRLNDKYGHQAGDAVLQEVGAILEQSVRPLDMVARYGGEEFIAILPNTARRGAFVLAQRIRRRVSKRRVEFDRRRLPAVTISGGVAVCTSVLPVEEVIGEADAALYRAKHAGRNCVSD